MDPMIGRMQALAHEQRLSVFRLLVRHYPSDVAAGDIAAALGLKGSTLSVYLATLLRAGLVRQRRVSRSLRYRADLESVGALAGFLAETCARRRFGVDGGAAPFPPDDGTGRVNVLFVCTENACRSILAEAILAHEAGERFNAFSAGTRPRFQVHPLTIALLSERGYDVSGLHTKALRSFTAADAPPIHALFTLCDDAANADEPELASAPVCAHWSVPRPYDPADVGSPASAGDRDDLSRRDAFERAFGILTRRIHAFASGIRDVRSRAALQDLADEVATLS